MNHPVRWIAAFSLGILSASSALASEAGNVTKSFNIAAGRAEKTLKKFTDQSGVVLIYATDDVRGVPTNAVSGDLAPTDALQKLLENTPLKVVPDEKPGAFAIRRETPRPTSVPTAGPVLGTVTPTSAAKEDTNGPVTMDPFKVSTDKDVGYMANSTLSGTQFNTDLKDTAASIQVITSEFIKDIGAFNVKDVMIYANNTVADMDETTAGGNPPNGNFLTGTYNQFRVRASDISQAEDYFVATNIPFDMYDIDRIEESRGPNSVLFGIGSPSGVLNYSTKQAILGKTDGDFSITAGSWGTIRETLDFNQSIGSKLALRLDLLNYHDGTYRYYAGADGREGAATLTFKPTSKIELRARFEAGSVQDEGARNEPLYDNGLIEWEHLGRPLFAQGATNNPDTNNWGFYGTPGSYSIPSILMAVNHPGTSATQVINESGQFFIGNIYPTPVILDSTNSNPKINGLGPEGRRTARWEQDSFSADIQLLPRLFLQVSYSHLQSATVAWNNPGDNYINVDANLTLANGQPNPDAGKLFFEGNGQTYDNSNVFDRGRILVSGEQDFGKWFGHYHVALSVEQDDNGQYGPAFNEVWKGNPFGGDPEYDTVTRRTYVNEGQWNTYYLVAPGNNNAFVANVTDPATGKSYSSVMAPYFISSDRTVQRDIMGVVQATYLDDRLAINAGGRRDTLSQYTRGTDRNPTTDFLQEDAPSGFTSAEGGNTTSVGGVLHLIKTKWLDFDLLADKSNNFGLPNAGLYDLTGAASGQTTQLMPASTGTGNEWGVAFTLLDGQLYLKAIRFSDNTHNLYNYIGEDEVGPKNDLILAALAQEGYISQATADARSMPLDNVTPYDVADNGTEVTLVANMTKNWRVQVNFSDQAPNETNVNGPDIGLWQKVLLPYFAQFPENLPNNTDPYDPGDTIAGEIAKTNTQLAYDTSVEGKGLIGFRRYKWNFFTRYTFANDCPIKFLRGLFVGGGYVFQSQMTIGTYPDGSVMFGGKTGTANGLLGYRTKLHGHDLRIQLNVLNLFNNTAPIIYRRETNVAYANNGTPTDTYYGNVGSYLLPVRVQLPDPRSWRLSADISF